MSKISKTTYTFTVLHETGVAPYSLEDALVQANDGNAVGADTVAETVEVPDEQVADELIALGNDGTFFDFELGLLED